MRRKKKVLYISLFILAYAFILWLLVAVESGASNASISTIGDAFWYSLATITTVGYGDSYPVTAFGRLLGLIFMLLSIGFLAFIINLFVLKFSQFVVPYFAIKLSGRNNQYIFDSVNEGALCLADDIIKNDPKAVIVFSDEKDEEKINHTAAKKAVFSGFKVRELVEMKKKKGKCYIFSMGEQGFDNYQNALSYKDLGAEIFCEAPMYIDGTPHNIHVFNIYSNVSNYLWTKYPLMRNEKKIVLIGCDNFGSAILEQALLVNVDRELGNREYHIFSDNDKFEKLHTELKECFGINERVEGKDTLFFHKEEAFSEMELLREADRIIICGDNDADNIEVYNYVYKYVPIKGRIFVYENSGMDFSENNYVFFGANESVLTYDYVIREKYTQKAKEMNETYCKNNPDYAVAWEELSIYKRRSNLSVADHTATKIRILLDDNEVEVNEERLKKARAIYEQTKESDAGLYRYLEHERWIRFVILNNWRYSEKRCDEKRLHNLILPFEKLSPEEQAKDDYAWKVL